MSMALHHVDDPEAMVTKSVERLKPGGTVVIIDWIPSERAFSQSSSSHSHENSHGYGTDSGLPRDGGPGQHPGSHTVSFDGFTKEHMDGMFAKAQCSETDYVLAASPSEVPPDPSVAIYNEAVARDLYPENLSGPRGSGDHPALLSALASFFNADFRPAIQVLPSYIVIATDRSSCLDRLFYTICDAGNSVLVLAPYWSTRRAIIGNLSLSIYDTHPYVKRCYPWMTMYHE
ncbi:hypothetical protein HO173_013413 [Letharia columbiana]|uniref:Uncharacterized protein n=1 Tax=Letharia columbiana TaxID=112416 RepID=A0A8H6CFZ6_9LECA|nr:uncharacterized protein HO173_013413 [Letharia columbiana]KAF6222489.1 hypothetical protein HO173_013413 [Letharia columbiana]